MDTETASLAESFFAEYCLFVNRNLGKAISGQLTRRSRLEARINAGVLATLDGADSLPVEISMQKGSAAAGGYALRRSEFVVPCRTICWIGLRTR